MSTYAVVKNMVIINAIEWDGVTPIYEAELKDGTIEAVIPMPDGAWIGWRQSPDREWHDPNPPPDPTTTPAPEPDHA